MLNESVSIKKLFKAMEFLRDRVYKELPIQQISIFLLATLNPGITFREIKETLDVHQATVSRNVKELSHYKVVDSSDNVVNKGHNLLVTAPNDYNRREYSVFLSTHGKLIAQQLEKIFE